MERHAIRSGNVDDEKGGYQTDRGFRDVDMDEDGEDQLDRTQNECRSIEKVEEKRSLMDIIRTRQKNWIGHILRGNFLQILIPLNRMMPLCLILHLVHLVYYQPPPWKYSTYIFITKNFYISWN